ncbi:MAG TPA: FtsX-like permease family protein [Candidatus Kapabacteria bacterium]|nr:FtsX-like permease family protein [Candidatus Kapabacteria bacterium]
MRGQLFAVALVVMCGVATFVTMVSVYQSLLATRAAYYQRYRFSDLFASVKRAPESVAREAEGIPGVAGVQSRIVMDVTLDVPGLGEPATGRLVSLPDGRDPLLNDIYLRRGARFDPGSSDQVIISEAFALANRLSPGDSLGAVLNGHLRHLRIVGVALSPEYVYEFSGRGSLFPDNRRFGIMWMSRDAMSAMFDMKGAFNDICLALVPGTSGRDVMDRLNSMLDRYGSPGAYDRSDQMSARFLSDELVQLRSSAVTIPVIFLGVAAFLLNIVLARLVGMQRDQIAVLKAFGYGDRAVGLHYFEFALSAVLVGAALGTGLGMWLGLGLTKVYTNYYRFPILTYVAGPDVIAWAIIIAGGAALIGALSAVRRAAKLPPAEAMRPALPQRFTAGPVERLGLTRFMAANTRMVVRNLERNPLKAFLSILGIALSVAILITGSFSYDAISYMNDLQFQTIEREDVTVVFNSGLSASAAHDLLNLPGVIRAEPFRSVPVRMRAMNHVRQLALQGLPGGSDLRRIVDSERRRRTLPPEGVVLTDNLAQLLGVRVGDSVAVEVLEGDRSTRRLMVTGTVNELLGTAGYMEITALNRLMREQGTISGAYLAVDGKQAPELYEKLKRTPAVAGVVVRRASLESFEKTIAESQNISRFAIVVFAGVIAFGVVYNSARISLSERGREMASLRVLGFSKAEVALMLLGEQAILTLLAIPLGFGLGYLFAASISASASSDLYRIPAVIAPATYARAAIMVVMASLFSALLVRRRLYQLDLVDVLKTRE